MAGSEKECAVGQPTSFDHHRLKTRYDDIDYKIFKAKYLGHSMLDKRYTQSMLPWIMTEIRRSSSTTLCNEVLLSLRDNKLKASISSSEAKLPDHMDGEDNVDLSRTVLLEHNLCDMSQFACAQSDNSLFAYLTCEGSESTMRCHMFHAADPEKVQELFKDIRVASKSALKTEGSCSQPLLDMETSCGDVFGHSHLFEVMYVGKVVVSDRKAAPTFIDGAVEQFKQNAKEKELKRMAAIPNNTSRGRHVSGGSNRSLPVNLEKVSVKENELQEKVVSRKLSQDSHTSSEDSSDSAMLGSRRRSSDAQSSKGNHTMLVQVGDKYLSLVSPDRKTCILQQPFTNISFCSQGIKHPDHFGFIANVTSQKQSKFVCYVFCCASEAVVSDVMQALKQAFESALQHQSVCTYCPMYQLHLLCHHIEGLNTTDIIEVLHSRMDEIGAAEKNRIISRIKKEMPLSTQEEIDIIMIELRHICELLQTRHHHQHSNKHSAQVNLIDLSVKPKLHNDTVRKARRSLSGSFDNLTQSKKILSSRDRLSECRDSITTTDSSEGACFTQSETSLVESESSSQSSQRSVPLGQPLDQQHHTHQSASNLERPDMFEDCDYQRLRHRLLGRPRSHSLATLTDLPVAKSHDTSLKPTPESKHNMFLSVNVPYRQQTPSPTLNSPSSTSTSFHTSMHSSVHTSVHTSPHRGAWRTDMLSRVVTPVRIHTIIEEDPAKQTADGKKRVLSSEMCKSLWKKAILETLLLIRMEKENISLQGYFILYGSQSVVLFKAHQDAVELRKVKLDYYEVTPCLDDVSAKWEDLLLTTPATKPIDLLHLNTSVRAGVPRSKRGSIWQFLVNQHALHHPSMIWGTSESDLIEPSKTDIEYEDLLKQLTAHQHAILIDLGRTFPQHQYFARQLGAGQLSLFNTLKAYSLIDPEVGYCQGLSFVAGILLMHMQEKEAFQMLKYMMYKMNLRLQYKPDMITLQIQLYQLSRLLHDYQRQLYDHFESHDIAPTLYAAPWFLTLYASQFPLGFVARVFDMLYIEGMEAIFKVALTLLEIHKVLLLQCDSFESLVEFLKTTLPELTIVQMEVVVQKAFQLKISRQLHAYEVEYHVIQEEITSPRQQHINAQSIPPSQHITDTSHAELQVISELQAENRTLKLENDDLNAQIKHAQHTLITKDKRIDGMQHKQNELSAHIKTLQLERSALMNTVARLQVLMNDCSDGTGRKRLLSADGKETITMIDNARSQLDREVSLLMNTMKIGVNNSNNTDNNNINMLN